MKLVHYSIEIAKEVFVNFCAGIITTLFIVDNEKGMIANSLLYAFLAAFLAAIICNAKQKIKELKQEESIAKIIKNIWDESLTQEPITNQIGKSSHYQNRLDDLLLKNLQTKFRNISWEKLQYIAKNRSLEGIDISRNNLVY